MYKLRLSHQRLSKAVYKIEFTWARHAAATVWAAVAGARRRPAPCALRPSECATGAPAWALRCLAALCLPPARDFYEKEPYSTRAQARIASYASHATDLSLSCIETHTTASTDPRRTDRIVNNVYMRYALMTSYGTRTITVDVVLFAAVVVVPTGIQAL
ncbi:hypothetical protein SFRURICE_006757 [Spodoptera frugiperda]|nr:hypothetical protein SFRURICE_006757 [Spodoptera frugiperda]